MRRWDPFPRVTEAGGRDALGLCPGATGREEGSLITHTLSRGQLPKLCPRDLEPEAARLPHCLASTPSISEFIWRKGTGLMKLHRDGRLGGTSGAYGIGVPWVGLVFWGGWPFDHTACQRWSLRGPGRRQRSKAGIITSHQTGGPATHPCPGTSCPRVSRGQGTLHPSPCHSGLHVLIVGDQKQPALVKESSTPGSFIGLVKKCVQVFLTIMQNTQKNFLARPILTTSHPHNSLQAPPPPSSS